MRKREVAAATIILGTLLMLASSPSHAAGFIGAGWGRSEMSAHELDLSFSDTDIGWKILGGFGPKYFGLELFYVDFGDFSDSSAGNQLDMDASGWDASFYGRLPIKKFEIFGKVGLIYWDAAGGVPPTAREGDSGTDLSWGLGLGWTFGEHFGIRVEYERFEINPSFAEVDDITLISLGIKYTF